MTIFFVEDGSPRRDRAPPPVGMRLPPGAHKSLQRRAAARPGGPDDQRVFAVEYVETATLTVAEPHSDREQRVVSFSLARQQPGRTDPTRQALDTCRRRSIDERGQFDRANEQLRFESDRCDEDSSGAWARHIGR